MSFKATESTSPRSFWCAVSKLRSKKSKLRLSRLVRYTVCISLKHHLQTNLAGLYICVFTVYRGKAMRDERAVTDLVLKNLKLYLENRSILEANEKLRHMASLLQQENNELTAQIRNEFSDLQ